MFINILGVWDPPHFKISMSDDFERLLAKATEITYNRFENKRDNLFSRFDEAPYGGFYILKHPESLFSADALILCVYMEGDNFRLPVGARISVVWSSNGSGLSVGFYPKTNLKYIKAGVLSFVNGHRIVECQVDDGQIGFWLYPLIKDCAPFGVIVNLDSAEFI